MAMGLAAVFSGAAMLVRMQGVGRIAALRRPDARDGPRPSCWAACCGPSWSRRFEKKKVLRAEAARRQAYAAYLDRVRARLRDEAARQREVLEENRVTVGECLRRAFERDPRLMDRTPAHDDFLEVRVGTGTVPLAADVRYPPTSASAWRGTTCPRRCCGWPASPRRCATRPCRCRLAANPVVGVGRPAPTRRAPWSSAWWRRSPACTPTRT